MDARTWGFRLRLHPRGSVSEARILFLPREWDRRERAFLAERLRPGAVFVDVGANVGGYAFWAASLVGETGRVLVFEPDPALVRQLRWNVGANRAEGRIRVVEAAVGASCGTGRLLRAAGNSGQNRLADDGEGLPVRVVALADAVAAVGLARIDALKVDVEGREADVLKSFFAVGPRRLRPRTLVVEFGDAPPPEGDDLAQWIVAQGYRLALRTKLNGVFEQA